MLTPTLSFNSYMHTTRSAVSAFLAATSILYCGGVSWCGEIAAAASSPIHLICPPSVAVEVPLAMSAQFAWKASGTSELYLNSATPISGPPELHGDLADYATRPGKTEWSYVYDLRREFPDGKWLECGYGGHNEVKLSQRMPDSIQACTFTYRKGKNAGQNAIRIDCTQ
jgi:hypothetical protein